MRVVEITQQSARPPLSRPVYRQKKRTPIKKKLSREELESRIQTCKNQIKRLPKAMRVLSQIEKDNPTEKPDHYKGLAGYVERAKDAPRRLKKFEGRLKALLATPAEKTQESPESGPE